MTFDVRGIFTLLIFLSCALLSCCVVPTKVTPQSQSKGIFLTFDQRGEAAKVIIIYNRGFRRNFMTKEISVSCH